MMVQVNWFSLVIDILLHSSGFLHNELEKAGVEVRPAGNIEAPDPQQLIDLEVWPLYLIISLLTQFLSC